jgi:hypothetical protein
MDIVLSLWSIDPSMEYLIVDGEIFEWRSVKPQPSQLQIESAWMSCPESFEFKCNKVKIVGDGVDAAIVSVRFPTLGDVTSVSVNVNGSVLVVQADEVDVLGYGYGSIELISSTPGTVIVVSGVGAFASRPSVSVEVI